MSALAFLEVLVDELTRSQPTYTVHAREPDASELEPGQIWISNEGIEASEGVADLGRSSRVIVPFFVLSVMSPTTDDVQFRAVLRRRLSILQALTRAAEAFVPQNAALVLLAGETTEIRKDMFLSSVEVRVQYDLESTGEPQ